ncbi:MAG: alpha/beta fold hydrolase, partial [candidate division NC10 bacterium]
VNQVMGDGIMALFGAPLAHEDHARRACYAALRMQERVGRYGDEVQRTHGVPVQIRVGLNSGDVVVRSIGSDLHMDYTAVGQTTHLAARMEQMAKPGSVLLTAETLGLAEGYVQVKPLGSFPVKGLETPVGVHELVGATSARSRLQAGAARGLSRFVGRDPEMEQLRRALSQAGAGQGQIVAVVGEPGVGKSRLFHEFIHSHHTAGWLILQATSASYGKASPYLPVTDLLKTYFQIESRDTAQPVREKVTGKILTLDEQLRVAIPPILWLLDALPDDSPLGSLGPLQRRGQTVDALRQLFLRESQRQPVALVFEDLHWVDPESQVVLDALADSIPTARVLLLTNYRPEYEDRWTSRTYYARLRVDPLPPESADALLDALLGEGATLAPLKALLKQRTEGNPLFLEESVRTLVETGALVGERGAYRLQRELRAIQVPATVQALLAARIDRLPAEQKQLLQSAAVIGTEVPLLLLRDISDQPEDAIRAALGSLQAGELLYETRLFPDPEYTFKHALTHEVAYGSLLQDTRRMLHRRVGEAMEARYGDRLGDFSESLGSHFERGGVWPKAARHYLDAALKAKDRYAYPSALRLCQHALDAAEKGEPAVEERVRSLVLLGDLWSLLGDLDQANHHYERALDAAASTGARRAIANRLHRPHSVVRDGAKIAFYEHGGGSQTILMVNPMLYGLAMFQPVLEQLGQEFRIITLDPRGTGASDPLPEQYSLRDHMEDVRAVIEEAGAAPIVGVGISRGGGLLVKLAVTYPGLVGRLVLVGTPTEFVPVPRMAEFSQALKSGDLEQAMRMFWPTVFSEPGTAALVEQAVQHSLRLPSETVLSFFAQDPERNIAPVLDQVRVPTLVIHGTADRRVPFDDARYLAEHIPGARLYPFEGSDHLPLFTATRAFCEALRQFVRTGTVPPGRDSTPRV